MHKVFVYGTLKKSRYNNYVIKEKTTRYLGNAETSSKYPMVVAQGFSFPFMLDKAGDGKIIQGEVYEINEEVLARLDKFEGHPGFYKREEIPVRLYSKGSTEDKLINCWCYLYKKYLPEHLELPFLDNF